MISFPANKNIDTLINNQKTAADVKLDGDIPQKWVTIPKGTTENLEYTANWSLSE